MASTFELDFNDMDPFSSENVSSPYKIYQQLRAHSPVCWSAKHNFWLVTGYEEVVSVLRDPRMLAGSERVASMFKQYNEAEQLTLLELRKSLELWALYSDPPVHTRLRAVLTSLFTPARIESLRVTISQITKDLLQNATQLSRDTFEVLDALATPLPVLVITELMGLPKKDAPLLKRWSDEISNFTARVERPIHLATKAALAFEDLHYYLAAKLKESIQGGTSNFLACLAAHRHGQYKLTDREITASCALLLFAGHETTTNLIANGVMLFCENAQEWLRLRKAPELADNAVEEILRFESPVQLTSRIAKDDLKIGGTHIRAGQRVMCCLGAANRDPRKFTEPDRFSISRKRPIRHLAFGHGPHFCAGAALGRLEGEIAFREIAMRFDRLLQLDEMLSWRDDIGMRGLKTLHVRGIVGSSE